jgi:hypothetical protein
MEIQIDDSVKADIARNGANKLFEIDFKIRKDMNEEELVKIFNNAWSSQIKQLIVASEPCHIDEVRRRLERVSFFNAKNTEYRAFRHEYADFIVQLTQSSKSNEYYLQNIYFVPSSDKNPRALFIEFDTIEEKEKFVALARKRNIKPSVLGLKLIKNFMELEPSD